MFSKLQRFDSRTFEELLSHYQVERELADRLRTASRQERRSLYGAVYDELYQRVPLHPQLTRKAFGDQAAKDLSKQLKFLQRFLSADITFLEVGAGDCALSFAVAQSVKKVYAIDVSGEITKGATQPSNFELILSDGVSIDLPANSIQMAYSNQLMEHLHPDDATEQLINIYRVLVPGGLYVCSTPNRLNGPHDISRHFDRVASGFHLHEYTMAELSNLFRRVGFSRVAAYLAGIYLEVPLIAVKTWEVLVDRIPGPLRQIAMRRLPFRLLLVTRLVGTK